MQAVVVVKVDVLQKKMEEGWAIPNLIYENEILALVEEELLML